MCEDLILTNLILMHEQKTSPYMVTSIIRRCDWLESGKTTILKMQNLKDAKQQVCMEELMWGLDQLPVAL